MNREHLGPSSSIDAVTELSSSEAEWNLNRSSEVSSKTRAFPTTKLSAVIVEI